MKAMLLRELGPVVAGRALLEFADVPVPEPAPGEVLLRLAACGVCHTELDEIEGRTAPPRLPVIPGHQAVGRIIEYGDSVPGTDLPISARPRIEDRVGVAWIFSACGHCEQCTAGNENLCPGFRATGRDVNGGYAEYMTAPAEFVHPIPDAISDIDAAPLLCAGAIGYRSLRLAGVRDGMRLGLTGFGGSGHLVLKMVRHRYPSARVYVFARHPEERAFALELGATWAGNTTDRAPVKLHAIIDTTPAWLPVLGALEQLEPGGRLVVNAIRKEDADKGHLLDLDYSRHLWLEKEVRSVANVARVDVREFLALAAEIPLRPEVETYDLRDAGRALLDLKTQRVRGAKVLRLA
ncbi:MAG TPA: zinc-dependent alcohol dehydrogenase family protein [Steroidobacteraceae bacterium]|nr:zinc-dependent alcohol dehydrogenase family protein [Steroidobacteraceae bacterium]